MFAIRLVALLTPLLVASAASAFQTPEEAQAWYDRKVQAHGAVHWDLLAELEVQARTIAPLQTEFTIVFPEAVRALDEQPVTLIGFIYPLESGREHRRFLLSALPPGCPFCLPGGPSSLIEVLCEEPVPHSDEPVVITGRFQIIKGDDSGLYYRLSEARPAD